MKKKKECAPRQARCQGYAHPGDESRLCAAQLAREAQRSGAPGAPLHSPVEDNGQPREWGLLCVWVHIDSVDSDVGAKLLAGRS